MKRYSVFEFIPVILVALLTFYLLGCEDTAEPKQKSYPIIQTSEITEIDDTGATFNGELLKEGTDSVMEYGFVWSRDTKPTVQDFKREIGPEVESTFSLRVSFDLITDEVYFVRVYAKTIKNIVYGNERKFKSLGSTKPVIHTFSPKNGIDADTVILSGENFGSLPSSSIVKIGIVQSKIIFASNDTLKVLVPVMPQAGPYKIQISTNGKSSSSTEDFIVESPGIESFTPVRGPDGTTITIKGSYFSYTSSYNKVFLNQVECQVLESNRNQIKIGTPYNQFVGFTKIVVSVNGKQTSSMNDYFVEGPFITRIDPILGKYQDVITISGEGFSSTTSENTVSFGSIKATVLSASATEMKVSVPALHNEQFIVSVKRGNKIYNYPAGFSAVNSWRKGAPQTFPGRERGMATGFSIGDKGFVTLGRISDYNLFQTSTNREMYTDLWEYNSINDLWTRRVDFPGEARYYPISFSIGSKGYVGTGVAMYGDLLSDFYEYDPQTNSWKKIANMPGTGRYASVAFSVNGKGYVGLGQGVYVGSSPYKSDFYEYDPISNTWTQFAGPGKASAYDFSFSVNNVGYVVIDGKELWEFNPSNHSWIRRADYPDNTLLGSFAFTIGNKAYAGSGLYNTGSDLPYSRNFYEYDPSTNQWTQLEGFEYLKRHSGVAWGLGNKGYVVTGQSNAVKGGSWPYYYVNDFWVYEKH